MCLSFSKTLYTKLFFYHYNICVLVELYLKQSILNIKLPIQDISSIKLDILSSESPFYNFSFIYINKILEFLCLANFRNYFVLKMIIKLAYKTMKKNKQDVSIKKKSNLKFDLIKKIEYS